MKVTLSIAMATYNGARFLREQLDSLYTQALVPDEVVVCDDQSTDGTVEILEEYHQRYGLIYSVNEHRLGVNGNFFKAMGLCSGDYICICDQDDVWFPHKVETLFEHMQTMPPTELNVVSSLRQDIDAQGHVLATQRHPYTQGWKATLLTYDRNQGCTMMMNREVGDKVLAVIQQHPKALTDIYYDEWIAYVAAILGNKHNLPDVLMSYRHHDRNVVDGAIHYGKKSLAMKVSELPTFYGFIPDERFMPLEIVYSVLKEQIEDKEVIDFLDKIVACNRQTGKVKKLMIILSMRCLCFPKRCEVAIKTSMSMILKRLFA